MTATTFLLAGRYRLDERIAVGGVGEVWRGADLVLERPVAVKLLLAQYALHEEALARFRAEARNAGSVSHPCIARVYDFGEEDPPNPPFLVLELVDGPSLAGRLAERPLEPAQTMDVVAQAAAGLHAAHTAGLVHRDIKPANLLLSKDGRVKITDFGISHAAGSAPVTCTGTLLGTPAYLAPERVAGASGTPAADLYALGIVAYECLAGQLPFQGSPLQVALAHRDRSLPALPESVPPPVAALVAELTAKAPGARPASAGEVAQRASRLRDEIAGRDVPRPAPVFRPSATTVANGHGRSIRNGRHGPAPTGLSATSPGVGALAPTGAWPVLESAQPGVDPARPGHDPAPASIGPAPASIGPHWPGYEPYWPGHEPYWPGHATDWSVLDPDQPGPEPRWPGLDPDDHSATPDAKPRQLPGFWPQRQSNGPRAGMAAIAVAAALTAGLAGWLLAWVFHPATAKGQAAAQPTPSATAALRMIRVDGAALTGRPVHEVRRQLSERGLIVRVVWRRDGQRPPGVVVSVQPTGSVPAGSLVLLTGSVRPPGHNPPGQSPGTSPGPVWPPGRGHGHGNHGDGGK
ncbi:MAG TPA: protein kinase [Streptosporangiaceae bacterium]